MFTEKKTPSLHELQLWMKWIITDPRGVAEALKESTPSKETPLKPRYTEPNFRIFPFIENKSSVDIIARLDVYAEGYFARILEALTQDFPLAKKLLGENLFRKFIADYLKNFPSRSPSISDVGQDLPAFAASSSWQKRFPPLSDLVLLDWLAIESFYSQDSDPIVPEELTLLKADDWEKVGFKIKPSLRVLTSPWPLEKIWPIRHLETAPDNFLIHCDEPRAFALYQLNGLVNFTTLMAPEKDLLLFLKDGKRLFEGLNLVTPQHPRYDLGDAVGSYFTQWLQNGFLQKVVL